MMDDVFIIDDLRSGITEEESAKLFELYTKALEKRIKPDALISGRVQIPCSEPCSDEY